MRAQESGLSITDAAVVRLAQQSMQTKPCSNSWADHFQQRPESNLNCSSTREEYVPLGSIVGPGKAWPVVLPQSDFNAAVL